MRKGFTLIEISVSVAILAVFTSIVFDIFIKLRAEEKIQITNVNSSFYMQEALMFIERELTTDTERVTAGGNKIEIIKSNGIDKNEISLVDDGKLKIMYMTLSNGYLKSSNNILVNVSEFNVAADRNLLFIRIKMKNGENLERCLGGFKLE